jgi:DNA-binding transcriptional LysR family regulator
MLAGRSVELALVRDCDDTGFDLERLFDDPLVAAIGTANAVGARADATFLDLADQPFVLFRHSGREQLYRAALSAFATAGFSPTTICEGAEVATMGELVMRGMAAAIAPRSVVDLWDQTRVRSIELPEPRPVSSIYLAQLPGHILSDSASRVARAIRRASSSRAHPSQELPLPAS